MIKKRIQPPTLMASPAFSQAIEVQRAEATLFIGGQNAVDEKGSTIGKDNFGMQCEQALRNVRAILEHAGYTVDHVVRWTIYMVQGNDPRAGFGAFQKVFGMLEMPPTISVVQVAELGSPEHLVEIEATAVR